MPLRARLSSLWSTIFRKAALDRDLDDELRSYVDELTAEYVRAGLAPDAARRRALVESGGIEQVKERVRDFRIGHSLDSAAADVRYAWRGTWKSPVFALVVIATIALGIGANSAIFSVVHAVLLEPLPYRDPSRLVFVWSDLTDAGYPRAPLSGPELNDLRQRGTHLAAVGGIWPNTAALTGDGDPEQLRIGRVTANFFDVLGAPAALGATFSSGHEASGASPSIVLSWALWQRRYGGDPGIVGRRLQVNGVPTTVVGVMPASFRLVFPPDANVPDDLQAWQPFGASFVYGPRAQYYLRVVARAQNGVGLDEAQQQVAAIGERIAREFTEYGASGRSLYAVPLQADSVREVRPALLALFGGVAILLLIACVNVSSLLIARAAARRRETALRVALGAGRGRLVRQCLAEGLVLAVLGGVAGLIVGRLVLGALRVLRPESLNRIELADFDPMVLTFTAGVALIWGLLFSMAPLVEVFRTDVVRGLQQDSQRTSAGVHYRARAALVVVQIALSVVLLVCAGLLARAFVQLQRVDPGFTSDRTETFRLALPGQRYRSPQALSAFSRELLDRLRALPGVNGAGAVSHLPFDNLPNWSSPYSPEEASDGSKMREADARAITPGYFEAMGVRLVDGRMFTESDDITSQPVVIVDERLAERAWPGQNAVGQRLRIPDALPGTPVVIGVVPHLRHRALTHEVREQVYLSVRQSLRNPMAFVVKSTTDPAGLAGPIRETVAAMDPQLPVYDVRPLDEYVTSAKSAQRFTTVLAAVFAAVALLLACLGVYGVMAYSVQQRRREFGVRLALGAQRYQLAQAVLNEGLRLAAAGTAAGLACAIAAAGALRTQLFAVTPYDPATYVGGAGVLVLAAFAACWIPARRSTRLNPVEALRVE